MTDLKLEQNKKKKEKSLGADCQISCMAQVPCCVRATLPPTPLHPTPKLNSLFFLASILYWWLKIASGLLQNKQFMHSGFDAAFAWRGQLSPACRSGTHCWFPKTHRALDFGHKTTRACLWILLFFDRETSAILKKSYCTFSLKHDKIDVLHEVCNLFIHKKENWKKKTFSSQG